MKISLLFLGLIFLSFVYAFRPSTELVEGDLLIVDKSLIIKEDKVAQTIAVYRAGQTKPILTQVAKADFRPYLHPIVAPDGKGVLTEYSPGHHKHQTGLYWGFTRVNGRDYFHHPQGDYWRRVSAKVVESKGKTVKWQTVYDLLDSTGRAVLTETQNWSMREQNGKYLLDLEWNGDAQTDITIGKYDYGGLFLRMPWKEGINGEVVNAARQRNEKAEGQSAPWVDVGMQVEGRNDLVHIAIFDHPQNRNYPTPWRVDSQLGIGPARARKGDWTIKKGAREILKHQLVVYTGKLNDVELTKFFGEFTGNKSDYTTASLWAVAQREGRDAKFLTPTEAVAAMTITKGYQVNVWASEPMMTQPMAFCWDDRGRLWIAENRDYESRGKGFSNAGDSRILILEDTDHDGVADSRKVFMEGIAFPAAIAVGMGGVFVGAPPNLLFIPDKNGDDKADVDDIEVRLTGWGIRDRHETLNSLHWGPDGWLYGCQGFATPSKVRKPTGKGRLYRHKDPFPDDLLQGEGVDINGGVWRYHPTKDRFEVVAHGFSNPWGIDFDAKGQLFITACVIPHLWHIIPGGIYHRQGGQHFNPYVYNDIKTIADHSHRSAHGGARIYQSDAFPKEQNGRIFMANIHEHGILSDVLKPKGSGFVGHHGEDFMMANNAQWVGFSLEIGPDGGLYALDWHDADICGSDVLNQETGRIFRIMPTNSQAKNWPDRYTDLSKLTDEQLANLQTSPSDWHARRARIILQGRAAKGKLNAEAIASLRAIYQANEESTNSDFRLRAMWALHITGNLSPEQLKMALSDKEPYVRAWAVQLLCEDQSPATDVLAEFSTMARQDRSPVVRLYLASAMQRLGYDTRWELAERLLTHAEDAGDHNLPKLIWFGMEPLVNGNTSRALDLATRSQIPMVTQFIARRAVDAQAIDALVATIGKLPKNRLNLLEGMRDAVEGRYDLTAPANWKIVYAKLKTDGTTSKLATEIAGQFGGTEMAVKSLALLKDAKTPVDSRKKALQALALQQRPELVKELPELLNNADLRPDAIRAIASYDNEPLGKLLLERYAGFNPAEKTEAIQTMASRPKYGWQLTQAIAKNTIPKRDVPTYVARQLRRVVGSGFVEVWGPIDHVALDEKAYARYRNLLTDQAVAAANPVKGRLVFQNTCGPCHKMYGEGGIIGPELTGSNRANLDYLLGNILDPSAEIQDDYKMVVVTTRDGRTYVGNVAKENERQLTLRVIGQDAVVVNKSDIQSREVSPASMMPTGLLDPLSETEIKDLVAFLRTTTQAKTLVRKK
ncbi:c-type cytochrome [Spirosoma sp. KCTC 42546]|uniref:PVC-type heme-binding CxxCH protein n=1 Tax=Spirosoma sp. KCTC 42546 TaxID=2520506 RepID=UPI001157AD79|nr:PVC-type heme-binding CxxCH protein [Spirosoma sp. KCTC 42546]QDK80945.1 c-type cytochrome [Spirosoma sp. KCTC 42546]